MAAERTGYIPPSRADIAVAIPPGSRRARSQREILTELAADPELAELRPDAQRNVMECARIWVRYADWRTRTTRPTRERVCKLVRSIRRRPGCQQCRQHAPHDHPLSQTAYKAARRWLEGHGYLGTVAGGTTPDLRPGILPGPDGNEAAVYVLTVPKQRRARHVPRSLIQPIRPPSCSRSELESPMRPREARSNPTVKGNVDRPTAGLIQKPLPSHSPRLAACPKNRIDARGACVAMQARSAELGLLSPEYVRSLVREFFRAGWTPGDVLHALDYEPTGRPHGYVQGVHHAAGWVRHRLGLWVRDGEIMRSRSQRAKAAAKQLAAEQARDRAQREADAAQVAANPAAHAAYARQLLSERRRPARQSPRAQPQPRRINTVNRDQPPHSDEAIAQTMGLMMDVGHNTVTGTPIASRRPAVVLAAIRQAIEPFWQWTNPETARDVMILAARLAWQSGVTSCPEDLADDSAETMLEFTAATAPDVSPQAAWAFASSVAFDRDEDAETFQTLCVLLVLAYLREPDEEMEAERQAVPSFDWEAAD